jgi:hypothetical protein
MILQSSALMDGLFASREFVVVQPAITLAVLERTK